MTGEMPEELLERTGACRFCGQMRILHITEEWSQERLNEEATLACQCADARTYQYRRESYLKAREAVDQLFSETCRIKWLYKIELDKNLKQQIYMLMEAMTAGMMTGVTINEGRVDIRLALTA